MTKYSDWYKTQPEKPFIRVSTKHAFDEGRRIGIEEAAEVARKYQRDKAVESCLYVAAYDIELRIHKLLEEKLNGA